MAAADAREATLKSNPHSDDTPRLAVIGAGWAGLAAAVTATQAGYQVTVFEMSPGPGGRARQIHSAPAHGFEPAFDNGQHLLIGAYRQTLALMALVGACPQEALGRTALHWVDIQGRGLCLPAGPPPWAFLRGVLAHPCWSWSERGALLGHAASWLVQRFRCDETMTVSQLTQTLPLRIRTELIDPLCVAALNTPAQEASAKVFLRVLRDAFAGRAGSADLLFAKCSLSALWPEPATLWLQAHGAQLRWHHRVMSLTPEGSRWQVDNECFDEVIVATTSAEAARLCRPVAAVWAEQALALTHEPIATVYVHAANVRLPYPMVRLSSDELQPAQFVLDHGHWGGPVGQMAMVVSGAGAWLAQGQASLTAAALRQLTQALGDQLHSPLVALRTLVDKRATFRCVAGLQRPPRQVVPGLQAAGDYVDGPYPSTLEGAMQSGVLATQHLRTRGTRLIDQ